MRIKYTFRCSECKHENYIGDKNKTKHPEKMQIQKFCSNCGKKTLHVEKSK